MIHLYHFWSSTCSRKVRICLAEKGIEWSSHHVDIVEKRENTEEWYVDINPKGVVPTLVYNDQIIIESNIIIEFLNELVNEPELMPKDPYGRAQVRLWLDRSENTVHKNINILSWNRRHMKRMAHFSHQEHLGILENFPAPDKRFAMVKRLKNGVTEEDEKNAITILTSFMDELDKALSKNVWVVGDNFTLADIAIAPFIERFEANKLNMLIDFQKWENIGRWWLELQSRSSYKIAYSFEKPASQ